MGQAFSHQCATRPLQLRSGRVHAEQDTDMLDIEKGPTMPQQQQGIMGSNASLQRGGAQSTLTHAAAVNGDKSALNKLLNNTRDELDAGDQFGRTPLMLAVLADRLECAELLIKHGAKVNRDDNAGRTALHWAAYKGNPRLCKLLLAKGANWKIKDKEGQSALHLATRHDNTKCLMLLIKQLEPGEQDEQDNAKRTALHWSSSYGNEEAVKLLIKHNSNIGIPDMDGKTPLHWAASAGHDISAVNTVQLILDTEPSVITWQDYEGRTALHLAVAQGNETIAQQLVNFQTSLVKCNVSVLDNMFRTPLHWAAVLGHTHIVELLLDAGASVTSSDANGATPLHYAAQNNHADTVAVFLSREGIMDEPDLEGRTALMWAAGKGADAVISRIVEISEPDINATDKTGATALHAAAMCGHPSTIQVLLELGANVNVMDQSKHTPLFRAAEMGHTNVVKVLVRGGAHGDIVDQEGRSPLHWAALGGHACICAILIGEGINPNIQDFTGRTPLQCASYGGFTNSMSLLLEKEADPNSQDSEGMTALHWCCSSGYLDAAKLLLDHGAFPNHMEYAEELLTPLDYALLNEHHHVAQYMIEQGALSITGIRDMAAIRVQAYFRGYRVRKTFVERKKLLMKHEQLRKDAAKKKVEMTRKIEMDETSRRDDKADQDTDDVMGERAHRQSVVAQPESIQPKKLCWETDKETGTGSEDISSEVKVETGSQDQSSSDSGRTSGFISDDVEHGKYKVDQTVYQKQTAVIIDSQPLSGNEVNGRINGGNVTDITDYVDMQVDDAVNANSNNSNSNSDSMLDRKTRIEKLQHDKYTHSRIKDGLDLCEVSSVNQPMTLEDRRQIVEGERLAVCRRKSDSAAVIQRAWRNFQQRRCMCPEGTTRQGTSRLTQLANSRTDPRAHHRTNAGCRAQCQQTAARSIQEAWRCGFKSKELAGMVGSRNSDRAWLSQLNALKQTLVMHQVYGKEQITVQPQRAAPSVRRARPHYQQCIPSAAALSFNFAVDQYRPMVRNVTTPSSIQRLKNQSKYTVRSSNSSSCTDGNRQRAGSGQSSKSVTSFSYNHY